MPRINKSRRVNDDYNIKVSHVYINGGYTYMLRRFPIIEFNEIPMNKKSEYVHTLISKFFVLCLLAMNCVWKVPVRPCVSMQPVNRSHIFSSATSSNFPPDSC